jgi:hypothetical protein
VPQPLIPPAELDSFSVAPSSTVNALSQPTATAVMVVFDGHEYLTEEEKRLKQDRDRDLYWKKWGPYVAERQWATGMAMLPIAPLSDERDC